MWCITYLYNHGHLSNRRYGVFIVNTWQQAIIYYFNNNRHRVGKPAVLVYFMDTINKKIYAINDKIHRTDGPAELYYTWILGLYHSAWVVNNRLHRLDGPAIEYHQRNVCCPKSNEYYINDVKVYKNKTIVAIIMIILVVIILVAVLV